MPFPFLIPAITAAAGFFGKHKNIIGKIADTAAPILGGMAKGRYEGRVTEGNQRNDQDAIRARLYEATTRNLLDRYGLESRNALDSQRNALESYGLQSRNLLDRARLGADKAGFEVNAPSARFDQALRGGLAANMQDVVAHVPQKYANSKVTFTGGLRPSAIGPQGRQAGAQLAALALDRMGKDTFELPTLPDAPTFGALPGAPDLPGAPGLSGLPKGNWLDKLLGAAGPATALLGGLPGGGRANVANGMQNPGLLGNVDFGGLSRPQVEPPLGSSGDEIGGIDPDALRRGLKRDNFGVGLP